MEKPKYDNKSKYEKQWERHSDWSCFVPMDSAVSEAKNMDVYTYLTSGRTSLGIDLIPKGAGFICNYYDGQDHDSGSCIVTEKRGFDHYSRGIHTKHALDFLVKYSNFSGKDDYSACINEIMNACGLGSLRPMEDVKQEYLSKKKILNPKIPAYAQRFTITPFLIVKDLDQLTPEQLSTIRPSKVSPDVWNSSSNIQKLLFIRNLATPAERAAIGNAFRYTTDRGKTFHAKKILDPIIEQDLELPEHLTKEIEQKDASGNPLLDAYGNIVIKNVSDNSRLFAYLTGSRGFSKEMVSWLLYKRYIYAGIQRTYIDKDGNERPFTKSVYNPETKKRETKEAPHYYVVATGRPSKVREMLSGVKGEELTKRLRDCEPITYAYKRETWEVWDKFHSEHPQYKTEWVLDDKGNHVLDKNGRWAKQFVTEPDSDGNPQKVMIKPFKGEATGSRKVDCWRHENMNSHTLYVFEAPFDAFSLMQLRAERVKDALEKRGVYKSFSDCLENDANYIALGGIAVAGLNDMLSYRTDITKVVICLDRDETHIDKMTGEVVEGAGQQGTKKLFEFIDSFNERRISNGLPAIQAFDIADDPNTKLDVSMFVKVGYDSLPSVKNGKVQSCKDINEFLRSYKANEENLSRMNKALYRDNSSVSPSSIRLPSVQNKEMNKTMPVPKPAERQVPVPKPMTQNMPQNTNKNRLKYDGPGGL